MSRSGYSDEGEYVHLWRGAVDSAIRGKRGQAALKEILEALDGLWIKRLNSNDLVCSDGVCALGALALKRGLQTRQVDPIDVGLVANTFGIAPALAAEIAYLNDEAPWYFETDEHRFDRMREWIVSQIRQEAGE